MKLQDRFNIKNTLVVVMSVLATIVVARAGSSTDARITQQAASDLRVSEGSRVSGVGVATNGSDDAIRRGVERALSARAANDSAGIQVLVKDGTVWLSGSVATWQGNDSRIHDVRSVTGVRSIVNRLRVVAVNDSRR